MSTVSIRPDVDWSLQLSRTSKGQLALWTGAALLMLAAHAGAAWLVMRTPAPPLVQIAGSAAIEVDLAALGFAEADQVSAGDAVDAAQPTEAEPVESVVTDATPVTPTETAETVEAVQPVETTPVDPQPVERAETVEPQQPTPPAEVAASEPVPTQAVPTEVSRLAEAVSEVQIAALPPVENEAVVIPETTPVVEAETLEPVDEAEQQVAALVHVPLPTPRPEPVQPQRRAEQPKREQPAPRQQTQRKAGSGGQNQADARKGTSEGSTQGRAAQQSSGARQNSAQGNAAVSNYPGQVARKLNRAVRPQRGRERGEVIVSFTVSKSGGVSSIRVARGSGSQALDRAALDTVNRAAPFPPIPDAAGRSSWSFNLPIAFTR